MTNNKLRFNQDELRQIFINSIGDISFDYRPHEKTYSLFCSVRLTAEQLEEKERLHNTADFLTHRIQKLNLERQLDKSMWADKLYRSSNITKILIATNLVFITALIAVFIGAK